MPNVNNSQQDKRESEKKVSDLLHGQPLQLWDLLQQPRLSAPDLGIQRHNFRPILFAGRCFRFLRHAIAKSTAEDQTLAKCKKRRRRRRKERVIPGGRIRCPNRWRHKGGRRRRHRKHCRH